MLRAEDFESLTKQLPRFIMIFLHSMHDPFLLAIIDLTKPSSQAVDVEHGEVGQKRNNDDNVDECSHGKLVVHAP